jgi:hypothetical protein
MGIDVLGYLKRRNGWSSTHIRKAEQALILRRHRATTMDWATKAYSGTAGCACGCNGDYYVTGDSPNDTKQFNRIARKVMAGLNDTDSVDWMHVWKDGAAIEYKHTIAGRVYALHRN